MITETSTGPRGCRAAREQDRGVFSGIAGRVLSPGVLSVRVRHVRCSVIKVLRMITEHDRCSEGCRVVRDRVGGAFRTSCGIVRRERAPARRPGNPGGPATPAARQPRRPGNPGGCGGPRKHQGSRPSLTASWPSLLLLVTGFNSNVALPDVVPTATGRATLLSGKTANSNGEGHDAHAAPAAPCRGGGAVPWQGVRPACTIHAAAPRHLKPYQALLPQLPHKHQRRQLAKPHSGAASVRRLTSG